MKQKKKLEINVIFYKDILSPWKKSIFIVFEFVYLQVQKNVEGWWKERWLGYGRNVETHGCVDEDDDDLNPMRSWIDYQEKSNPLIFDRWKTQTQRHKERMIGGDIVFCFVCLLFYLK